VLPDLTWAEQEMLEGYRDGLNADSPEPSDNRSASYRHGFQSGRNDLTHKRASAAERRALGDQALAADSAEVMP
jgi:hypothetical protein